MIFNLGGTTGYQSRKPRTPKVRIKEKTCNDKEKYRGNRVTRCARCSLTILNTVLLLLGLILLLLGVNISLEVGGPWDAWLMGGIADAGVETDVSNFKVSVFVKPVAPYLMAVGGCMMLMALIGFSDKKKWLFIYLIIAFGLLIAHVVLVYNMYKDPSLFDNLVKSKLLNSIKDFAGIESTSLESLGWNFLMITFECCGVDSYKDFMDLTKWPPPTLMGVHFDELKSMKTPLACCKNIPDISPKSTDTVSGTSANSPGNQINVSGTPNNSSGNQNAVSVTHNNSSGNQTTVSGTHNNSSGNQMNVSGTNNSSSGNQMNVSGTNNSSSGNQNAVSVTQNSSGNQTALSGKRKRSSGNQTTVSGTHNNSSGNQTTVSGTHNNSSGNQMNVSGTNNSSSGNQIAVSVTQNSPVNQTIASETNNSSSNHNTVEQISTATTYTTSLPVEDMAAAIAAIQCATINGSNSSNNFMDTGCYDWLYETVVYHDAMKPFIVGSTIFQVLMVLLSVLCLRRNKTSDQDQLKETSGHNPGKSWVCCCRHNPGQSWVPQICSCCCCSNSGQDQQKETNEHNPGKRLPESGIANSGSSNRNIYQDQTNKIANSGSSNRNIDQDQTNKIANSGSSNRNIDQDQTNKTMKHKQIKKTKKNSHTQSLSDSESDQDQVKKTKKHEQMNYGAQGYHNPKFDQYEMNHGAQGYYTPEFDQYQMNSGAQGYYTPEFDQYQMNNTKTYESNSNILPQESASSSWKRVTNSIHSRKTSFKDIVEATRVETSSSSSLKEHEIDQRDVQSDIKTPESTEVEEGLIARIIHTINDAIGN